MTREEVVAVLDAGDVEACIALFKNATEAERRRAAKPCIARLRALTANIPGRVAANLDVLAGSGLSRFYAPPRQSDLATARAAVLATATLVELKRLGPRVFAAQEIAFRVLSARRPDWLGEWAGFLLDARGQTQWPLVRHWVRNGLCPCPEGSAYIEEMLSFLPHSVFHSQKPLRDVLLEDPGLLDDEIWRIFDSEPRPGRREIPSYSPGLDPGHYWETTLAELANEGRISRSRLLDSSLEGLERDFHELRARWFVLIHEALKPTAGERAVRAQRYLRLLPSRNASTVAFALKNLTGVPLRAGSVSGMDEGQSLLPGRVVESVGPALLARAKTTVRTGLDLLHHAAECDPSLKRRVAGLAAEALLHESPDVHRHVLDLVERHGDPADVALASLVRERRDMVAPSQRARLEAWLGKASAVADDAEEDVPLTEPLAALERASALDPRLAELAGVLVAIECVHRADGVPPAMAFDALAVPRLDPGTAIRPIRDLDELIECFSAVLERPSADDIERVLDGLSRLCGQRPSDLEARTGPLQKRIEQIEKVTHSLTVPLLGLGRSWATGRLHPVKYADLEGYILGFLARRVLRLAERVVQQHAAPLLSAPTHAGGWIDPEALVDRLGEQLALGMPLDPWDGAQALLRLAADHRDEAIRAATPFDGEYGAALRHALGAPSETVGPTAALWVAAARARAPRLDDPDVEQCFPGLGPDAARAARCTLRTNAPRHPRWSDPESYRIIRDPPLPSTHLLDLPTVFLNWCMKIGDGDATRWAATVWPSGHESLFAAGVDWLAGRDEDGLFWALGMRPFLEPLRHPDEPFGPMACLLLAAALSEKRPELSGLAVDVLIAAIDDGRLDGRNLGEALNAYGRTGLPIPSRWAKRLGEVARASPLHAQVLAHALQIALDIGQALLSIAGPTLFELLKELLVETGEPLSFPPAREALGRLTRAGKTGKLVKEILAHKGSADRAHARSAAIHALVGRIERAERWARYAH